MTAFIGLVYCIFREKIKECTLLSSIIVHGVYDAMIVLWVSILWTDRKDVVRLDVDIKRTFKEALICLKMLNKKLDSALEGIQSAIFYFLSVYLTGSSSIFNRVPYLFLFTANCYYTPVTKWFLGENLVSLFLCCPVDIFLELTQAAPAPVRGLPHPKWAAPKVNPWIRNACLAETKVGCRTVPDGRLTTAEKLLPFRRPEL